MNLNKYILCIAFNCITLIFKIEYFKSLKINEILIITILIFYIIIYILLLYNIITFINKTY